jgi:hypothetical protein
VPYLIEDGNTCSPVMPICTDPYVGRSGCATCGSLFVTNIECLTCLEGYYLSGTECEECIVTDCAVCPGDVCSSCKATA